MKTLPEAGVKTKELYEGILFNLGQAAKCYNKDSLLVEEVKEREKILGRVIKDD